MARGTYLGVGVADVDGDRARTLKLKEPRGAEVTMVNEDTPAAKAGIRVGDVILEYNGQPVQGTQELQRLVRETPAGRQVKIGLWRNGAPVTLNVTVEESKGAYTYDWPFGDFNVPSFPAHADDRYSAHVDHLPKHGAGDRVRSPGPPTRSLPNSSA